MVLLIGVLVLMIPCVITDIRLMKVPSWYIGTFMVVALFINVTWMKIESEQLIAGLVVGGMFFLLAFFSKQAVSFGDAFMITAIGAWCGMRLQLLIILMSFLSAAIIGTIRKVLTKEKWSLRLPFAPFLGVAATAICILEW